mgnify:CR=1 FL=1
MNRYDMLILELLKQIGDKLDKMVLLLESMEKENAPSGEGQKQTTKKYFLHGTKEQSGEDRKKLANAIREILLDQSKGG